MPAWNKSVSLAVGVLLAPFLAVATTRAGQLVLEFDSWYGEDGHPDGNPPWMRETSDDDGTPGTVRLNIETLLDSAGEHVKQVNFNLDPLLSVGALTFSQTSGPTIESFQQATDSLSAGPGQKFDLQINWKNHDLNGSSVAEFLFSGIPGLTAQSFFLQNAEDLSGPLAYAAAHVGGIGDDDQSSWIASVPLPTPMCLAGWALLLLPVLVRLHSMRSSSESV